MIALLSALLLSLLAVAKSPGRFWRRLASWRGSAYARAYVRGSAREAMLACGLIASLAAGAAAACPTTAPRSGVTDPAAVLGQHAGAIAGRLAAYQRTTGHQLFVVIAPSLDAGISVEQCAVTVFHNWQLGRKGVDDGVLLLGSPSKRERCASRSATASRAC
jgi:hypothetical protein